MSERACEKCKRPLEPVHSAEKLAVDIGVLYADNLWAIDGKATDMTRAWACRRTCGDPVPIEDTPEALKEWQEASEAALKRLAGRPVRRSHAGQPCKDDHIKANCPACLEPGTMLLHAGSDGNAVILCPCGFSVVVPPGPNPAKDVALEIVGADELGEKQEADLHAAKAWIDGAKATAIVAHRPQTGDHTEEAFVAHRNRYMRSAAMNGPYAEGTDCVAEAVMDRERVVRERLEAELHQASEWLELARQRHENLAEQLKLAQQHEEKRRVR